MRGDAARVEIVRHARTLSLPLIVLAELRAGFAAGRQTNMNAANLHRFLNSPRVTVLLPDEQTTHHYARLFLQLRQKGAAIPTNDLWIAALTVQHDLILCSSDAHFDNLPQIPRC
jgi:predicted nucleic acid-binding protein